MTAKLYKRLQTIVLLTYLFLLCASTGKFMASSTCNMVESPPANDYAADVVGTYTGKGHFQKRHILLSSGPITNMVVTLVRVNSEKANIHVDATLPGIAGRQRFNSTVDVNSYHEFSGKLSVTLKVVGYQEFAITGSINTTDKTLKMAMKNSKLGNATATLETKKFDVIPKITIGQEPSDVRITQGSSTESLSVRARVTENMNLMYQWYENTTNSNSGGKPIINATNRNFMIPTSLTVVRGPDYFFYCVVSAGGAQSVTSNVAKVTVIAR